MRVEIKLITYLHVLPIRMMLGLVERINSVGFFSVACRIGSSLLVCCLDFLTILMTWLFWCIKSASAGIIFPLMRLVVYVRTAQWAVLPVLSFLLSLHACLFFFFHSIPVSRPDCLPSLPDRVRRLSWNNVLDFFFVFDCSVSFLHFTFPSPLFFVKSSKQAFYKKLISYWLFLCCIAYYIILLNIFLGYFFKS